MYNHRVLHGPKEQRCATLRRKATARTSGGADRMYTYVPRVVDGQLGHAGIAVVRLLGSIQFSLWRDHAGLRLRWVGLVG